MPLQTNERLQEAFSLALESRSAGYQDLISNSNGIYFMMRSKGGFREFTGPTIRERLLFAESNSYTRYAGFEFLNPRPAELINDAEFTPKLGAVSVTLSGEQILHNSGATQLMDVMSLHISAAEQELMDRFTEDLHGDGTLDSGKQIGGLQLAIPTDPTAGTYGGIDRSDADNAIWRTSEYDIDTDFSGITQMTSATVKTIFKNVMIERSRGAKGPDVFASAQEHFTAYADTLENIQRINDNTGLGGAGFTSLRYSAAGKSIEVLLEGGIGTAMPSDVTYVLDTENLCFRYHPERNFSKIGGEMMPVNQDAIVQHIGFMGELTLKNPLHMAKIYDSDTAS